MFDVGRCLDCKVSRNLSLCNPLIASKTFRITCEDFVGWAAHQTFFSVASISDSDILAALQTVQTVLRTQSIVLTPMCFRCSRVVEPGKGFVAIWIPVGLSSGLSP